MKKIRIKGIAIGKVESIPLSKNYDYEILEVYKDIYEFTNKNLYNVSFSEKDNEILKKARNTIKNFLNPNPPQNSLISIDEDDIKETFSDSTFTTFGLGFGTGENKITDIINQLLTSSFLILKGATKVFIDIKCTGDTLLSEAQEIADKIREAVETDIENIMFTLEVDSDRFSDEDSMEVFVFANNYK